MAALGDLSEDISRIVERAAASVVRVDARRGRPASGIVWDSNLVLTADHVLEHDDGIEVGVAAMSVNATIAGRDPGTDLALLRTEGLLAPSAARRASAELRIGHIVLALGRPGELQVTIGLVSALSGSFRSWRGGEVERLIQTSVDLLPGFSGGPLIDSEGRVVGVNSWNLGRGVSRALPIETVTTVVNSLKTHGRIRRAYLGVGTQVVQLAGPAQAKLGRDSALLVVTVEANGPAARAGLLQGDTIVALDGTPVAQLDDLFRALRSLQVGSEHSIRLLRAGEAIDVPITVGERAP